MEKYLETSGVEITDENNRQISIEQDGDFIVIDKSDLPALIEFLTEVLNSK